MTESRQSTAYTWAPSSCAAAEYYRDKSWFVTSDACLIGNARGRSRAMRAELGPPHSIESHALGPDEEVLGAREPRPSKEPMYEALTRDKGPFFNALAWSDKTDRDSQDVEDNPRAQALWDYAVASGVRTFVVEDGYTDRDYLDDYTRAYARSHPGYVSRCRRIHMFRQHFDTASFVQAVASKEGLAGHLEDDAYLGFTVVRPLPEAIVGRTVLAAPRWAVPEGNTVCFAATHSYRAHFGGSCLVIPNALAFQEQDSVLGGCATIALWSALHQMSHLYGTERPSAGEITARATREGPAGRAFPSRSLTLDQMLRALRCFGLEPELITCGPGTPVLSIVHAYLSMGLPVVVVTSGGDEVRHAITLTGYEIGPASESQERVAELAPGMRRIGQRVTALYGHDDQAGPYSRFTVSQSRFDRRAESLSRVALARPGKSGAMDLIIPDHLLIPVYPKVRLRYADVERHLRGITRGIARVMGGIGGTYWNLYLTEVNAWRTTVRLERPAWPPTDQLVTMSMPRFLWVARVQTREGTPVVDLLFDATGIDRSLPLQQIVFHDAAKYQKALQTLRDTPKPDMAEDPKFDQPPRRLWKMLRIALGLADDDPSATPAGGSKTVGI